MPNSPDFSLGVLAAGLSKRMERDKAWLPLGDATMIEQVIRRCAGPSTTILISAAEGRHLPPSLDVFEKCPDRYLDAGPLAGFESLRRVADSEWLVIVPCDMPFLDHEVLQRLVAAGQAHLGCDQVILKGERGRYSLPQALGPDAYGPILAAIESGNNRLLGWADPARCLALDAVPLVEQRGGNLLENLNHSETYEEAKRSFAASADRELTPDVDDGFEPC
ncbi:MAG: molybdenum cofactor guanylyltransferase [Planctomycetota bacterium]